MADDKMLEQIQKIIALAEAAGTDAESKNAMGHAQRLMDKHQIDMQQVKDFAAIDREPYVQDTLFFENLKRKPVELKYVWSLVEKFYYVKIITSTEINPQTKSYQRCAIFVGKRDAVDIAMFVFNFLLTNFRVTWHDFQCRTGARVDARDAYYRGFKDALFEKLNIERAQVEKEMNALILIDPKLNEAYEKFFPKRRGGYSSHKRSQNEFAYEAGQKAGSSLNIGRPVARGNAVKLLAN